MRLSILALLLLATLTASTHQPPWTLTLRSVGPVRIGSTIAEFRRAMGRDLAPGRIASDCGTASTRDEQVYFGTARGRLSEARVVGGSIRTPSGVGIGTSMNDLLRAYSGRLVDGGIEPDGGGQYFYYVPQDAADQSYRIVFFVYEGRVATMTVGMLPDVLAQGEASRCYGEMMD